MSFLRHKSEEDAFKTLEEAMPYMSRIDGFGLDSSEMGNPPSKFKRLYEKLGEITDDKTHQPKKKTAHICEEGPPEYAEEALAMGIDRGDHGNRILEKPSLVEKIVKLKLGLTVCPLSNLKLRVVKTMTEHPLKTMLEHGIKATVNSDDPAYFGGYINENFTSVADALKLTQNDIITLARNAIEISFLSPEQKAQQTQKLNDYIAAK
jgi:adenine deaminase